VVAAAGKHYFLICHNGNDELPFSTAEMKT
jgi:hypothetical protein